MCDAVGALCGAPIFLLASISDIKSALHRQTNTRVVAHQKTLWRKTDPTTPYTDMGAWPRGADHSKVWAALTQSKTTKQPKLIGPGRASAKSKEASILRWWRRSLPFAKSTNQRPRGGATSFSSTAGSKSRQMIRPSRHLESALSRQGRHSGANASIRSWDHAVQQTSPETDASQMRPLSNCCGHGQPSRAVWMMSLAAAWQLLLPLVHALGQQNGDFHLAWKDPGPSRPCF